MTDHRPEGSVSSTAPGVSGGISETELRCQSVHHPLSKSPPAQTEMAGKIMRSEALLDETHTQLVSPPRTPMVSLPTPLARLHLAFKPPHHPHTRAASSFGTRYNSGGRRIACS
ncbi:hypothetical protein NQZ68_016142 [Dissostichus eleginoides]|nr:hypothetical protein NQZ68_016142 [Dissostichus eleginoides]